MVLLDDDTGGGWEIFNIQPVTIIDFNELEGFGGSPVTLTLIWEDEVPGNPNGWAVSCSVASVETTAEIGDEPEKLIITISDLRDSDIVIKNSALSGSMTFHVIND